MNATQLIGKKAIRTKPCKLKEAEQTPPMFGMLAMGIGTATHDYSYSREPIIILAATESHIVYKHTDDSVYAKMGNGKVETHILDSRWCDDNWTDYDELMKLAEPAIQELVKDAASVSEIP